MVSEDRQISVPDFLALKASGEKITMLTAYDYITARLLDTTGIEGILVGDSLSMVVQGRPNTLRTTLDEMVYHTEMVARAVRHALVVADMPFLTYHVGSSRAIENAGRILKEGGCQAVKLEGGADRAGVISDLVSAGIPVMGHCGLHPQRVQQLGGYRVQRNREQLLADAKAVEGAGAFAMVLECIPADIAQEISSTLSIPTIGIGAGPGCDGQILVMHDLLGLSSGRAGRHVRAYADLTSQVVQAVSQYRDDVRQGTFPGPNETFH
jgi:3-methyl-2-oxobutanoate hydroxymethyltransferase